MLLSLALLAQLSVAQLTPGSSSARLLPAAATEYTPHRVWMPFAVGGMVTVGGGLTVLALVVLLQVGPWAGIGVGVVVFLSSLAILNVSAGFAIAYAVENAVHRAKAIPVPAPQGAGWLPQPMTPVLRF